MRPVRPYLPALFLVISLVIATIIALPGGVTARSMFQSSPASPPPATPSLTPTATPTSTLPPTLLPPTLVPTLTFTPIPTATSTATPTATATPTLAPAAKTATAAARSYLPPPTLTSPGMMPPIIEAPPSGPGSATTGDNPDPLSDLPIRTPTPEPSVLDRFTGSHGAGTGYIWLCFGTLLLVGGVAGLALLLRYRP